MIEPGQFVDVRFQARDPAEPTQLRFAAIQTYESGEVVEWTGAEGSEHPASTVEIVAASEPCASSTSATTRGRPRSS